MTEQHRENQNNVVTIEPGVADGTGMFNSPTMAVQAPLMITISTQVVTEITTPFPRYDALDDITIERQIERKFRELADEWHNETDFLSSPSKRKNHRAYRKILSMGRVAILYILRDLRDRGGDWSEALIDISGDNPIPVEMHGRTQLINEAWLNWGRERGYGV